MPRRSTKKNAILDTDIVRDTTDLESAFGRYRRRSRRSSFGSGGLYAPFGGLTDRWYTPEPQAPTSREVPRRNSYGSGYTPKPKLRGLLGFGRELTQTGYDGLWNAYPVVNPPSWNRTLLGGSHYVSQSWDSPSLSDVHRY